MAWPLAGHALLATAVYLVLVVATPPNVVRSAFGLLTSVAAGYAALSLIARSVRLSRPELLAYSVGLGILSTGGAAVLLAGARLPVGDFAALVPAVPLTSLAAWRHRPWTLSLRGPTRSLFRAFSFPEYSPRERWLARGLYTAILAALLILVSVAMVPYRDTLSPGLTLAGPDGSPGSLPSSLARNEPQEFVVGVLGGSSSQSFALRLRLAPQNGTGNESYHVVSWGNPLGLDPLAESAVNVSVAARGSWSERIFLSVDASGPWAIEFDLMDGPEVVASVHLPVTVTG